MIWPCNVYPNTLSNSHLITLQYCISPPFCPDVIIIYYSSSIQFPITFTHHSMLYLCTFSSSICTKVDFSKYMYEAKRRRVSWRDLGHKQWRMSHLLHKQESCLGSSLSIDYHQVFWHPLTAQVVLCFNTLWSCYCNRQDRVVVVDS